MKNKSTKLLTFLIVFITFCNQSYSQIVNNNSELQTAITNASAGTTIILANGIWTDINISINKTGTITNPVIIRAENPGQVFFEGDCNISLGGNYIFFEGFIFQNPSNLTSSGGNIEPIIEFRDTSNNACNNCKVANIKIDNYNGTAAQATDTFKWILVYGQFNEISNNSFIGKHGIGSIINDNRNDTNPDYTKIHHNYFADRTAVGEVNALNDQDAIRIGNSSTSLSDSFTEIYDNLFYNWSGEVEIISNKSGKNKYYNNTFKDYQGTLTLRHGNDCEVYNNYFFADNNLFSGGIRVIGEGHKVYNNYIEAVNSEKPDGSNTKTAGAINISNGRPNTALNGYYQVKNTTIVNNTFVNCDYGFRIGTNVGSNLTLAPENIIVANNIMLNTSDNAFDEQTAAIGSSIYEGNITQNGSWDLTNGADNNQTVTSGLLVSGSDFYQLATGSTAINAGVGSYSFLTDDILGGIRDSSIDAGAEEFGANGTNLPYTTADLGVTIGFLSAQTPFLNGSTTTITYPITGGNIDFDVNSNISWTLSDDADWLTLNASNGTNSTTITATASNNTSGTVRTAIITILENGGTLNHTINVTQSDGTFDPNNAVPITGISVTGIGTQDPNIPENTIDDDVTTRWSANSNNGSVYITYDLQCSKTVTSIAIYFHKGSTRTSYFKIATSIDGITYTDTTANVISSSGTTVGFESFALANNLVIRYIRILGYGNSEGSGWNSYEEVEIHGENVTCSVLNTTTKTIEEKGITIYPIPNKNDFIYIKSQKETLIGGIEVFDITGKTLIKAQLLNTNGKINISKLSSGIYIIKIQNTYSRFVIK